MNHWNTIRVVMAVLSIPGLIILVMMLYSITADANSSISPFCLIYGFLSLIILYFAISGKLPGLREKEPGERLEHEEKNGEEHAKYELQWLSEEYRYRDQLMVTEFGLSMTAVALGVNAWLISKSRPMEFFIAIVTLLFSLLIANHLRRLRSDLKIAGKRQIILLEYLDLVPVNQGLAGRTRLFSFNALTSFVVFAWLVFLSGFFMVLYVYFDGARCLMENTLRFLGAFCCLP